jgi:hypothetical protein
MVIRFSAAASTELNSFSPPGVTIVSVHSGIGVKTGAALTGAAVGAALGCSVIAGVTSGWAVAARPPAQQTTVINRNAVTNNVTFIFFILNILQSNDIIYIILVKKAIFG